MIRGKSSCWDWHNTYLIGALGLFLIIAFVTFEMHEATDYQGSTLFEQCCAGSACQWITKDEFKPFLLTVSLTLRPGMMQSIYTCPRPCFLPTSITCYVLRTGTLGEWAHLAKWVREYEPRTLTCVESLLSYQHDLDHIKSHRPLRYETYSYPEEGKQNELFFIEKYCSKEDFLVTCVLCPHFFDTRFIILQNTYSRV